jgi:methylated-DNA-[protein]-cysteine S-methyltransferase
VARIARHAHHPIGFAELMRTRVFTRVLSPLGDLILTASDTALTGLHFPTSRRGPPPTTSTGWVEDSGEGPASDLLARASEQLGEYFSRERTTFDLPLEATGSVFEHRMWIALRAIPFGTSVTQVELARRLGDKQAIHAVTAATAANPLPIIVPCHRIVGAKGELTGFGAALDRKRWLLEHEGSVMALGV